MGRLQSIFQFHKIDISTGAHPTTQPQSRPHSRNTNTIRTHANPRRPAQTYIKGASRKENFTTKELCSCAVQIGCNSERQARSAARAGKRGARRGDIIKRRKIKQRRKINPMCNACQCCSLYLPAQKRKKKPNVRTTIERKGQDSIQDQPSGEKGAVPV